MTRIRFPWPSLAVAACITAGCDCSGSALVMDAATPDASTTLDAHVVDAAHEADAFLEDDAAPAVDAALPFDASCPDAGGPHDVDDAGMCPPGWEPTPAGWCVTDFVPPAVCR